MINYLENNNTEYQELEYDTMYPEVLRHEKAFLESNYNVDILSEYDCIENYLKNEIR
tara:strand:+ start:2542 stop:2712 length:171 start_codon:yes stop_codon:yes gene_type:complete